MAVKFTDEQREAIEDDEHNLLVSASAGSGKTTVMIQRIIYLLNKYKNSENPLSISDFLIVTFTKASASDMKQKLIKSLLELDQDEFVLLQIEKIPTSDISNLHSFCSRLITNYFYEVGIDPSIHIIDDMEADFLKNKAIDKLFEKKEIEGNDDYFSLFDIFQKKRGDFYFREVIKRFDANLKENIDEKKWFFDSIEHCYCDDLSKNEAAKIINNHAVNLIKSFREEIEELLKLSNDSKCDKLSDYLVDLSSEIGCVHFKNSYMVNAQNVNNIKIKSFPKLNEDFNHLEVIVKPVIARLKKAIENLSANFISSDECVLKNNINLSKEILLKLFNLVCEFDEIYAKLKKDVNGLDFHDLEHYALKILENNDICESIKKKYRYVLVDEYQDINNIQEKIISRVSSKKNRFMVGDLKQSIYRFRFCDPDIFLDKFQKYSKNDEDNRLIQLNCNFRSDKKILKFVDYVFSGVMTESFGEYDYAKNAIFSPGDINLDNKNAANLCFINIPKQNKQKNQNQGVYSVQKHVNLEVFEQNKAKVEAVFVANKIKEILSVRNDVSYSDFAVLVSSRNETIDEFISTLKDLDIPVASDKKYDLIKMPHIQEIINFIKLCVNKNNDYILFKVLKSRIFGFTNNELVKIRLKNKSDRFFEVFYKIDDCEDEKLKQKINDFKAVLEKFSYIAGILQVKEFVNEIIKEFDLKLINFASEDGTQKCKDIDDFIFALPSVDVFDYVSMYADFSLIKEGECSGNAVNIMTIHKSKGIEFKFVFLINLANEFNFKSTYSNILFNKNLGVGIDAFDIDSRIQSSTIPISAIRIVEKRKLVEEQQRVLYVAMTRAVEKLFVVCSENVDNMSNEFSKKPVAFIDWFVPIIKKELNGIHQEFLNFEKYEFDDFFVNNEHKDKKLCLTKLKNVPIVDWFKYSFDDLKNIPLKNSISKILYANKEDLDYENHKFSGEMISSAERGTLIHNILQKIDLKNLENIETQVDNILSGLSEEELNLIDKEKIIKIFDLEIFRCISNSDIVFQEREFYAKMKCSIIDENAQDEEFILQGIIDLVIIKENEVWILDYKTGKFSNEKMNDYKKQVNVYADVCERAFCRKVTKKIICFVDEQKNIEF